MTDWIQQIDDTLGQYLGISALTVEKIVWTIAIGLFFLLLRRAGVHVLNRRLEDTARRYIAVKTVNYLLGMLAVLALLAKLVSTERSCGDISTMNVFTQEYVYGASKGGEQRDGLPSVNVASLKSSRAFGVKPEKSDSTWKIASNLFISASLRGVYSLM